MEKNYHLKSSLKSTSESQDLPTKSDKITAPEEKTVNLTISSKKEDHSSLPTQSTQPIDDNLSLRFLANPSHFLTSSL